MKSFKFLQLDSTLEESLMGSVNHSNNRSTIFLEINILMAYAMLVTNLAKVQNLEEF